MESGVKALFERYERLFRMALARGSEPDIFIDFEVHYLVQQLHDLPKIFGWISGDEQAVLKLHGIT